MNDYTPSQMEFMLICQAPKEIPEWFKPDMTGVEPPSPEQEIMAGPIEALFEFRIPLNVATIQQWKEAKRAVQAYNREFALRKVAQWPKAYARMVLEA